MTTDCGPDPVQEEPTGPALGNYPANPEGWPERRRTVGVKLARFLNDLAERVKEWK